MNIFNSSKKYRIKLKMKTDVSGGLDVAFGLVGAQGSNVFKLTSSYQTYYIDVQNIDTSKSNNIWLDVRQAFNANQNLIYVYGIEIYEIS